MLPVKEQLGGHGGTDCHVFYKVSLRETETEVVTISSNEQ